MLRTEDYNIQEIPSNHFDQVQCHLGLIQSELAKDIKTIRKDKSGELYCLLSSAFYLWGIYQKEKIVSSVSILEIPGTSSYYITDLAKSKNCTVGMVTFKMLRHFLGLKELWNKEFSFLFVEDDFKALENLILLAQRKFKWTKEESIVHSNVFFVDNNVYELNDAPRLEKVIAGIKCTFYSDKSSRTFLTNGKVFLRAYVAMDRVVEEVDLLKTIVDEGKKYAREIGCNAFVLLTSSSRKLNQDYVYINRIIELGNTHFAARTKVLQQGILL